tara:strand:+ start:88 stop:636 length:549 start_codon:yes stop_codon:yes gene_type:complete
MGRPSSISRLPKEVREKISHLRDQGRTIDEIMDHLEQLDVEVSRSSLGRHLKKQKEVAAQIRKSRQLAEAVGRQFGDSETSKVARTNIELLHSMLMQIFIGGEDGEMGEVRLDPKDAMMLATALQKLSQASKLDVDRELKIREEVRKKTTADAADAAVKTARKQGLTKETVEAIKAEILGIA